MKPFIIAILLLSLTAAAPAAEWELLETNPDGMKLYLKHGECAGSVCRSSLWIKGKEDGPKDGLYAYPEIDCDKQLFRDSRPAERVTVGKGTTMTYPKGDWDAVRDKSAVQKVMKAVCPEKR